MLYLHINSSLSPTATRRLIKTPPILCIDDQDGDGDGGGGAGDRAHGLDLHVAIRWLLSH